MQRGDAAVFSITAAVGAAVVALVAVSLLVVDRSPDPVSSEPAASTSSLLVLTWAPNLCTAAAGSPGCATGHVAGMGRTFVLHGLWPQPPDEQFCGVPKKVAEQARDLKSSEMPSVPLPQQLQGDLQSVFTDVGVMAPHEWYRHGSCSGVTPAAYFGAAARLTAQISHELDPVFDKARGGEVSLATVREKFDTDFGAGAGNRVGFECREVGDQILIFEVRLSLPPVTDFSAAGTGLAGLLGKGPTIPAGCRKGRAL